MGGNLTLIVEGREYSSDPIDITEMNSNEFREDVLALLTHLRVCQKFWDSPLYGFMIDEFAAGSTRFLWGYDRLLRQFKPVFGDLDFQVDKEKRSHVEHQLNGLVGRMISKFRLIGLKRSAGQMITLWDYFGKNIQIDFEFVEFFRNRPTDWSKFSHSSEWVDILRGIKGVFHKFLLRALTAPSVATRMVSKPNGMLDEVTDSLWAFSIQYGLRRKYEPVEDDLWVLKKPSESVYHKDLEYMFWILFGTHQYEIHKEYFKSFTGLVYLIQSLLPMEQHLPIVNGFARVLWGRGAQMIDSNPIEDELCKSTAMDHIINILNITDRHMINEMRDIYYSL